MTDFVKRNEKNELLFTKDLFNLDKIFNQLTLWPNWSFSSFENPMNVVEEDGSTLVELDVPGFSKDVLKVEVNGDVVSVCADVKTDTDGRKSRSSFFQSVRVPGVQKDQVTAKLENGVLTVQCPKLESQKPRKVEINE